MPLDADDQSFLIAAQGYTELGMHLDANEELEKISPDVRHDPAVLEVRLHIYLQLEKWDLMQAVASHLAKHDPEQPQWAISWAYATRRAVSIEAAKQILLEALELHPDESILHFNLACYECQLGNMEAAKARLSKAITLDKQFRQLALEENDLEPLWASLGTASK